MLDPPKKPEPFIIPPDPAIVEGNAHPGDRIVIEHKKHKHKHHHHSEDAENGDGIQGVRHAATIPMSHDEREEREALQVERDLSSSSSESSPNSQKPSPFPHTRSAPSEVQVIVQDDPGVPAPPSPVAPDPTIPLIHSSEREYNNHS